VTRDEASAVAAAPLDVVENRLRDVESWTSFLAGVEQITKTSFERYTFRLRDRGRSVPMVVRFRAREHRFTWRPFGATVYSGSLRLEALPGDWTRVVLRLVTQPEGFLPNLIGTVAPSRSRVMIDAHLLQSYLDALGRPRGEGAGIGAAGG
jgi:Polyketide cyclase / dehydrase and lipid transport